jgi:hypothetical protein
MLGLRYRCGKRDQKHLREGQEKVRMKSRLNCNEVHMEARSSSKQQPALENVTGFDQSPCDSAPLLCGSRTVARHQPWGWRVVKVGHLVTEPLMFSGMPLQSVSRCEFTHVPNSLLASYEGVQFWIYPMCRSITHLIPTSHELLMIDTCRITRVTTFATWLLQYVSFYAACTALHIYSTYYWCSISSLHMIRAFQPTHAL